MNTLIVATTNQGKVKEIQKILGDIGIQAKTITELQLDKEVEENGRTFEENAVIKAMAFREDTDAMILADDSGLEIDYLNKEPGVHSARYLGEETPYVIKNKMILDRLEGVPKEKRTARFVCAMALSIKGCEPIVVRETIEGYIGFQPQGEGGFGYDPIFYSDELGKSLSEVTLDEKNKISHRGKALLKIKEQIKQALD